MGKTINVGVVGVGIGRVHIEGYKKLPDVEIAAVCDLNQERGQSVASEFSIEKVYTQYLELIANPAIDAVSVCTPNAYHAEIASAALNAGKHVICEKPMADTLEHAEAIVAAADIAKANGQIFMMGMNNRFTGGSQVIKRYAAQGEFGEIYFAKCGWIRRNGIPGFGGWFTTKHLSGGGPLIDIGVHVLDLTIYLMGNPVPVSASGSTYAKFGPRGRGTGGWGLQTPGATTFDVEDLAAGIVKFDNGATLMLEASWASYIKEDLLYSSILGTEGGADLHPLRIYKDIAGTPVNIEPLSPDINGHHAEIAHFIECIREKKQPITTAEQGLHILQILNAIYQSAETSKEVVITQNKKSASF